LPNTQTINDLLLSRAGKIQTEKNKQSSDMPGLPGIYNYRRFSNYNVYWEHRPAV